MAEIVGKREELHGDLPAFKELPKGTQLSTYIAPLHQALEKAFGEKISKLDRVADRAKLAELESLEAFDIIHPFFQKNPFPKDLKLSDEDVIYLACNPIGNLIRRPVVQQYFAHQLEGQINAVSEPETKLKDAVVAYFHAESWSRFAGNPGLYEKIKEKYGDGVARNVYHNALDGVNDIEGLAAVAPMFAEQVMVL